MARQSCSFCRVNPSRLGRLQHGVWAAPLTAAVSAPGVRSGAPAPKRHVGIPWLPWLRIPRRSAPRGHEAKAVRALELDLCTDLLKPAASPPLRFVGGCYHSELFAVSLEAWSPTQRFGSFQPVLTVDRKTRG